MTKNEIITLSIAAWGALLSTINLLFIFIKNITDSRALKVNCFQATVTGEVAVKHLVFEITNKKQKPVSITHLGGKYRKLSPSYFGIKNASFPRTLNYGEQFSFSALTTEIEGELASLYAIDTLGKIHKCPKKLVNKINANQAVKDAK